MSYFDEEYDYDALANGAYDIEESEDSDEYCYDNYQDDGVTAWENYYHNITDELVDE